VTGLIRRFFDGAKDTLSPVLSRHAGVVEAGPGHEAGHVPNPAATREGKSRGLLGFAFRIAGKALDYVDKAPRAFFFV
jgi:hypothetical protein